jgi:hypothetical protein
MPEFLFHVIVQIYGKNCFAGMSNRLERFGFLVSGIGYQKKKFPDVVYVSLCLDCIGETNYNSNSNTEVKMETKGRKSVGNSLGLINFGKSSFDTG